MLCKLQNVKKLCLRIAFLSILVFNVTAIVWAPLARAQASSSEHTDGIISVTVLLKESHRPASQVAVKLKSHAAGIFRSVLTDLEGHFGVVQTNLGRFAEATEAFQTSIDLSGGRYAQADFGLAYLLYREGRPEEAVTMVRRGLEKDGSSPQAYFILGVALLRLNRLDEAESSAREALLRNPNFAEGFLLLSDVAGRRHEYLTQLQGLDTYLKLEPNGTESERVRRARELVSGLAARTRPEE